MGAAAEVVEEHRGRLGLPPVFLHRQRVSWVELETGAELHVRLLLARNELPSPVSSSGCVTRATESRSLHPAVVAAYPEGDSWPPAPDLRQAHRRTRRVRRWASGAILLPGSSTCSTRSPRRCGAGSTSCSSSSRCGPA